MLAFSYILDNNSELLMLIALGDLCKVNMQFKEGGCAGSRSPGYDDPLYFHGQPRCQTQSRRPAAAGCKEVVNEETGRIGRPSRCVKLIRKPTIWREGKITV